MNWAGIAVAMLGVAFAAYWRGRTVEAARWLRACRIVAGRESARAGTGADAYALLREVQELVD